MAGNAVAAGSCLVVVLLVSACYHLKVRRDEMSCRQMLKTMRMLGLGTNE